MKLTRDIIIIFFSNLLWINILAQNPAKPVTIFLSNCPKPQTIVIPVSGDYNRSYINWDEKGPYTVKLFPPAKIPLPVVCRYANGIETSDQSIAGIGFFTNYNTDNGLALDAVFCSKRDHFGNLWFGTAGGGVTRYDGKSFTNYTVANGLANNAVFSIEEDRNGNLWFGTYGGGVSCYNGISFHNYTTAQGLTNNFVVSIMEDKSGKLWFGTEGGGVSCFDGKSFSNFTSVQGLCDNNVRCICEDNKGNIWFGTNGNGVSKYDGKSFSNYSPMSDTHFNAIFSIVKDKTGNLWFGSYGGGLACYDGKTFSTLTVKNGLTNNYIRTIYIDKNGMIWLGTAYGGISCYNGNTFTNYTVAQGLVNNNVRSIIEDKNGNLWFSTGGGGISRFNGKSFINYTTAQGLANNYLRSIYEDKNGIYWFGTWGGGVSRYDKMSFTNFSFNQGLPNNYVNSIAEDNKGNLWFATDRGGVSRYDGKTFTNFTTKQGLINNNIKCLYKEKNGNLWFGTGGGLSCFDGISFINYDTTQGLADNNVLCIAEDKNGNLWFGTQGGGVSLFDGISFSNYTTKQGLANNIVYNITVDSKGNIWFGTLGGGISRILANDLKKFVNKSDKIFSQNNPSLSLFKNFTSKNGLASDVINGIIEDKKGNMIIGTNLGFTVLTPTEKNIGSKIITPGEEQAWLISIYNSNTGYPVKDINGGINNHGAMFCDSKGIIWAGTGSDKTALVRFDLNAVNISLEEPKVILQSIKINNENISWYTLKSKSSKIKQNINDIDSLTLLNDEINTFGRTLSDAERDTLSQKFSNIYFDSITRFYPIPINLVLPFKNNNITFEYAAIEPSRPYLVKYQYILEGYDDGWNPVTTKTSASFGNISEGIYTFKIKACSPDGVWSKPISYAFEVLPPWYRTWWMYSLYLIAFIFGIWSFFKRKELKHKNEKNILEQEVKNRTEQLEKANEEILHGIAIAEKSAQIKQQFLANMSHEIRTPMNAIMGMLSLISNTNLNDTQADYVQTIQGASDNLLNIINDILDLSKIEAGKMNININTLNIEETARKIKKLFEESAKRKHIDFNVHIAQNIPKYIKADENRIIQIVTNLVANAFKFTEQGSINVNFSATNQDNNKILFRIEVADTGIGITENDQLKLFTKFSQLDNTFTRTYDGAGLGLAISKELTELMGGEIGVKSENNKGSNFWFTFIATPSDESDFNNLKNFYQNFKEMKFNLTVLLVEDKFVNQKVESLMLENAGCKVYLAGNGKEAVDMIAENNNYDIIFMDIQMPVMDGVEAVRILRQTHSQLPPIIGLSANALEGDAERYINLGMDDYLSKPFTSEQINEKIYKWSHYKEN